MFMDDVKAMAAQPVSAPKKLKSRSSEVVSAVFRLLDAEGIRYALVHGYEGLPDQHGSDIDIVLDRGVSADRLRQFFAGKEHELGARLVRCSGTYLTLGLVDEAGLPRFMILDFSYDYAHGALTLAAGDDILARRRRHGEIFIAAAADSFACRFARAVLKQRLDAETLAPLGILFAEDPQGAEQALGRHWPAPRAAQIAAAARSGAWDRVIAEAVPLRRELRRSLFLQQPAQVLSRMAMSQFARLGRFLSPPGINVVMLGPDGAGKSSTIAALEEALAPLFAGSEVRGFAPSLKQLLKRPPSSTATPHALKPRSPAVSLVRAAYWTAYGLLSHVSLRWARSRGRLVLNDRHFVDILVDPVRYRYGGPRWLLHAVSAVMPRADLVILLYGPAEILQARKKELTVEETARQCRDYLALVKPMRAGQVIDATQPFPAVVCDVVNAVLSRKGWAPLG